MGMNDFEKKVIEACKNYAEDIWESSKFKTNLEINYDPSVKKYDIQVYKENKEKQKTYLGCLEFFVSKGKIESIKNIEDCFFTSKILEQI